MGKWLNFSSKISFSQIEKKKKNQQQRERLLQLCSKDPGNNFYIHPQAKNGTIQTLREITISID